MINLTLVVHADVKQVLADILRDIAQVSDFMFTHVESHGFQDEYDPELSAFDRVVGYTTHVRVDIIIEEQDVDDVLQALRCAECGLAGRGSYWVSPISNRGVL